MTHPRRAFFGWLAVLGLALGSGCGSKLDLVIGNNHGPVGSAGSSTVGGSAGLSAGGTSGDEAGASGKTDAGASGSTDAGAGGVGPALCTTGELPAAASLIHRYAFDGLGTVITDSAGVAPGLLIATDASALDGKGALNLLGGRSYVDLPNGLISSLTDATMMAWVSWPNGGYAFQRIFDFGDTTLGAPGTPGENPDWATTDKKLDYGGVSFIMATPLTNFDPGFKMGMELKTAATGQVSYGSSHSVNDSDIHQISVVFEDGVGLRLYLDGVSVGAESAPLAHLAAIHDVNDWLGRSQTKSNGPYQGSFYEFRIYKSALSECAIATEYLVGPDSPAP